MSSNKSHTSVGNILEQDSKPNSASVFDEALIKTDSILDSGNEEGSRQDTERESDESYKNIRP